MQRWIRGLVAAAVVSAGLTGCSSASGGGGGTRPVIRVDRAAALADQPVHLRITGLSTYGTVTVRSEATASDGSVWHGDAVFTADSHGTVDVDGQAPVSGTYHTADGMGLFWSMVPPKGDPDTTTFGRGLPQAGSPAYRVRLTAKEQGAPAASRTLTRRWVTPGVRSRKLTLAHDHVVGELFLPPEGAPRAAPVLEFGGSEGGNSSVWDAALLASRGHPALALAYFDEPGLPKELRDVPIEYFATAARLLAAQPSADPSSLVAIGGSRGSEAALLLAQHLPRLVHGAVLLSGSSIVNPGFPHGGTAWTLGGKPVAEGPVLLGHVSGPILDIVGLDDQVWASPRYARSLRDEARLDGDRYPVRVLDYAGAGHGVGTSPYTPPTTGTRPSANGTGLRLGGSRAADAAASERAWPRILAYLSGEWDGGGKG
ncbi:acyl-CoA thioesterase/BAAT N-terminal domain-containing protein [Streptomyces sp. NRRL F-5126]|uniref:acyl-CoA thioesterase/BAAT N-terminal domain-containing protein n=1 Tax=Streptomyces sp. NRRL F-5126 TaxID=1463857 RepID=UPI0004C87E36|nr:acyl-CoA thioesterase/BAAT N-terminal domain-containing protein [Streptomyces sp. NRRL F-5126]